MNNQLIFFAVSAAIMATIYTLNIVRGREPKPEVEIQETETKTPDMKAEVKKPGKMPFL